MLKLERGQSGSYVLPCGKIFERWDAADAHCRLECARCRQAGSDLIWERSSEFDESGDVVQLQG